jgi:hypothetical protein
VADAEGAPMTDQRHPERGRAPEAAGLCRPFLDALPVTSASVSVFDGVGRQSTVCASGPVAARLDELQLELGVGPQWDALSLARPVLVPDLAGPAGDSWVAFTSAALELGVRAYFAFPMLVGVAAVGVVGLSAPRVRVLDAEQIAAAAQLSRRSTAPALAQAIADADGGSNERASSPGMRREVHQATGMILAQLDVSATEAFFRLRAHAFASSRPIEEIARLVVTREIDFRELDPQ